MAIDSTTRRMIEQFGGRFVINKKPLPHKKPLVRAIERAKVVKGMEFPHEFPVDGERAQLTVLWPQYYKRAHQARAILRRALEASHVHEEDVAHVWGVPRELREPPLPLDIAANLINIGAALEAANSEHVLLVGGNVIALWSNKAQVTRVAGNGYVWDKYYVYPSYHPLALTHQLDIAEWRKAFRRVAWGSIEGTIFNSLDVRCHEPGCDMEGIAFDEQAMAWCSSHYVATRIGKQARKWKKHANQSQQQPLL